MLCAASFILFLGGIGAGKTFGGALWAATQILDNPRLVGFIGARSYKQLTHVPLATLRTLFWSWGIPTVYNERPPTSWGTSRFTHHAGILSVLTPGGMAQVHCRQLTNYDDIRGLEFAWAWIDEGREIKREAFDVVLGRLRGFGDVQYRILVTSSPKGFNWMHKRFIATGDDALKNREVIRATTFSNPWNPSDYGDRLLGQYSGKLAQQEVYARFVSLASGQAYEFDRTLHTHPGCIYLPQLALVHAFDFNVNPLCSNIGITDLNLVDRNRARTWWIDEIHIEGSARTRDAVEEFLTRNNGLYGKHPGPVWVYGDMSGAHRDTRGPETDWQQIQQAYRGVFGSRLQMRQNHSNPMQADRVNASNSRLCNAKGEIREWIHPRCENLIRDREQVAFKPGTRQLDKGDGEITHHADAADYFNHREFPVTHREMRRIAMPGN